MLDQDETSSVIKVLSKNIEEFMIGLHQSRCIVASRYFRRPRFVATNVRTLEILQMSERKIRQTLENSNRLTSVEIDDFFKSRNQWIYYATNPFVANLIVSFISNNKGVPPSDKIQVYDNYVLRRLESILSIIVKYKSSIPAVTKIAMLISLE